MAYVSLQMFLLFCPDFKIELLMIKNDFFTIGNAIYLCMKINRKSHVHQYKKKYK